VSAAAKARAKRHLEAHARSAGVGEHSADAHIAQFFALPTLTLKEENGRYSSRIPVLPEGKFVHPWYGDIDFSAPILRRVVRNFNNNVLNTDIAVDEGHDRGKALGWFRSLNHGKHDFGGHEHVGLFGDVEWTDIGRSLLERDIYRYFSAEIGAFTGPDGKKIENVLFGGGLTNRPFFKQMPRVQFAEGEADNLVHVGMFSDSLWQFQDGDDNGEEGESFFTGFHVQDDEEVEDGNVNYTDLIAKLNKDYHLELSEDEDETAAVVLAAFDDGRELESIRKKFSDAGFTFGDGADIAEVVLAGYNALKTQNTENTESIKAIRKELDDTKASTAVDKLIDSGKLAPAKRDSYIKLFSTNQELFGELTKDLEPLFVQGEIGGNGVPEAPGHAKEGEFKDPTKAKEEADRYMQLVPALEERLARGRK
jgi:phage I-like protein